MAHFNHMDKPYFIERDLVTPPLDLQRQVSPWIEKVFDDPRIKRLASSWIKTCDEEMEGGDTNVASETDVWWKMNEEDVEGDRCDHGHVSNTYEHGSIVDLIAFLKLMVRMRRFILQDSVIRRWNINNILRSGTSLECGKTSMQQLQQGYQMQLQLRQFEQKQHNRMDGTRMAENVLPPLRRKPGNQWRIQREIQQPDRQQQHHRQQDRQQYQQQSQQRSQQQGQQLDQQRGQGQDQQQGEQQIQGQGQQQQEFQ
ncbi:hypothetical protein EMPS_04070 [Entomortierella parvispora]|uniref:Uncharacterized protein n=1 Tax=Entomortierella parvispora TaxID=205924 RepID=A0A9P3H8F2_9FUNG|nr:hypothetical protein EMPS_04070 [Entomortierella parvispora]